MAAGLAPASIDATLEALRDELATARALYVGGYVLFGSIVLYLHGLRDMVGDVDVFVRPEVWERLSGRIGWSARIPRIEDPPVLEGRMPKPGPDVHAFYAWNRRDTWVSVERCFAMREDVNGWSCVPLPEILLHKQQAISAAPGLDAPQAKHRDDVELLSRHLGL